MIKLLDFNAVWCQPCKIMSPIIEDIEKEFKDKLEIIKIDVDKESKKADEYNVMSIPTFVILKDNKEIGRTTGTISKQNLIKLLGF